MRVNTVRQLKIRRLATESDDSKHELRAALLPGNHELFDQRFSMLLLCCTTFDQKAIRRLGEGNVTAARKLDDLPGHCGVQLLATICEHRGHSLLWHRDPLEDWNQLAEAALFARELHQLRQDLLGCSGERHRQLAPLPPRDCEQLEGGESFLELLHPQSRLHDNDSGSHGETHTVFPHLGSEGFDLLEVPRREVHTQNDFVGSLIWCPITAWEHAKNPLHHLNVHSLPESLQELIDHHHVVFVSILLESGLKFGDDLWCFLSRSTHTLHNLRHLYWRELLEFFQ
mmetsp:Transcript_19300/g.51558  ORF Transcript_19300/g.51558 Transcript_19300/m.51558 type:complete len:285 (+) Transcript_19300:2438-3292(+)